MTDQAILLVQPNVRWRDVFNLNFPNDNLQRRAIKFLDLFEQAAFPYDVMDSQAGVVKTLYLSGQDILQQAIKRREQIQQLMAATKGTEIGNVFAKQDIIKTGKYPIFQHDRPYNGSDQDECFTRHASVPGVGSFPLFITIGSDYLKGAKYKGEDSELYPVSVDGVLAHEIAHLAYGTLEEEIPLMVEDVVISAMGAVRRAPDNGGIIFNRGSNGGFQSMAHKINPQGLSNLFSAPANGVNVSASEIPKEQNYPQDVGMHLK